MNVVAIATVLLVGVFAGAPSVDVTQGDHIRVVSHQDTDAMRSIDADRAATWDLEVSADTAGTLDLWIDMHGDTSAFRVAVTACERGAAERESCRGPEVGSTQTSTAVTRLPLGHQGAELQRYRVEVSLVEPGPARVDLEFHVSGMGEEVTAIPSPGAATLPVTGGALQYLAPYGAGIGIAGIVLLATRRWRRRA